MEKAYHYFLITGGEIQAAHEKFMALRDSQWDARAKLCEEFGAKACYANECRVVGLVFSPEKTPPAGWKQVKGEPGVFRPHGRGFNELRKRMEQDYPFSGASKFQELVLGRDNPFEFMDGMSMRFMIYEKIGQHLILLVPKLEKQAAWFEGKFVPPDDKCTPLKTSEYWRLKEEHEAANLASAL